jgi:hypothetical protein
LAKAEANFSVVNCAEQIQQLVSVDREETGTADGGTREDGQGENSRGLESQRFV